MILTVTLNPALDLTYHVDTVVPGATHRVSRVDERAGGKGINVARVLHALGEPVLATGLLGGYVGDQVRQLLDDTELPADFTTIEGHTRRTVVAADGRDATGFWEPGPQVSAAEWDAFCEHFARLCAQAQVVVCSGSLPAGLPDDSYAQLIGVAKVAGAATVLDTSGPALAAGLAAGPDVVKPNALELSDLVATVPAGTAVVASHGPDGLHAVTPQGSWRARPPQPIDGNPTGAGDACVAALANGIHRHTPWPWRLRDAVALSAAAVAAPVAGSFDPDLYQQLRPLVTVEEC